METVKCHSSGGTEKKVGKIKVIIVGVYEVIGAKYLLITSLQLY